MKNEEEKVKYRISPNGNYDGERVSTTDPRTEMET